MLLADLLATLTRDNVNMIERLTIRDVDRRLRPSPAAHPPGVGLPLDHLTHELRLPARRSRPPRETT
jgi:hypothetical protein